MCKDTLGYLWIGTQSGLSRFDGQQFRNYRHRENDSSSLGGNWIEEIIEDNEGNLWIASLRGGLNRYDQKLDRFTAYLHHPEDSLSLPTNELSTVYLDSKGMIWYGTYRKGFGIFDKNTHTCEPFNLGSNFMNPQQAWEGNTVFTMLEDLSDPNIMWIGAQSGLYRFNISEKKLELQRNPYNKNSSGIHDLYMEHPGELWVGFWGSGIGKFSITDKEWKIFLPDPIKYRQRDGYSNACLDLERKSLNELWVAGGYDGLGVFNTETGEFRYIDPSVQVNSNQSSGFVFRVLVDEQDGVWICDQVNGIFQIDPSRQLFRHISTKTQKRGSREGLNAANDFAYDPVGETYYVATGQGDGLYIYNKDLKLVTTAPSIEPTKYNYYQFVDLHLDKRSRVWVIDWLQNKILRYDPSTQKCIPEKLNIQAQYPPGNFTFSDILEDSKGNLWIGTYYGGLLWYDPEKGQLRRYCGNDPDQSLTDKAQITDMIIAPDGKIWLSTINYGIYIFDPVSGTFVHLGEMDLKKPGLVENRVHALTIDNDNNIWAGFYTKGIQIIPYENPWNPEIRLLTYENGLTNENITGLVSDQNGDIWAQTQGGVFKYNYESQYFTLYSEKEGILKYLKPYGIEVLKNGEICIGESEGFYIFHPDRLYKNINKPRPTITGFRIGQNPIQPSKRIDFMDTIELAFRDHFFTIEFAALNYQLPQKNTYSYMLEGLDPDWVYSGNRQSASYTGVREGSYLFRVKAANNDQIWSEYATQLVIIIQPPWFRSWWAYILYGLLVFGFIFYIYIYQYRRWQLKTQLKLKGEEAKRLKDLDQTKSRIYSNITHEFRTPLTVIQGMVEQIKNDPGDKLNERVDIIKRNSKSLLQLINQMLELSKLESGYLKLNYIYGDITKYLGYLTESFHSFANDKGIHLNFYAENQPVFMDYDPEKTDRIMSNLISNALKFTNQFGKVLVIARKKEIKGTAFLEIEVQDNGRGMTKEELSKIFERFYQGEDLKTPNAGGTGIGLALVNELIRLMDGNIFVQSEAGTGSSFFVQLPIHDFAVIEEERYSPTEQSQLQSTEIKTQKIKEPDTVIGDEKPILLIIEDNKDVVYYLMSILESRYKVYVATDGEKGIKKAFDLVPDIIISDVMMPIKNGYEVCEALKSNELTNHIPIIILTAKTTHEDRIFGLKKGADAYLMKPFEQEELLIRLEKLIEVRHQIRDHYLANQLSPKNSFSETPEAQFIQKLNELIEGNMEKESFDIIRLSHLLGMSRSQLHRKLKALLNTTPALYIRLLRLEKAKMLLLQTDQNISEIAYSTGFKSPSYFTYSFSEQYGISPSEFREKN